MRIPESLSVTWYESISGEELNPYRKLNCHVVKSFLGGYEPFRALIHRNVPIRSIGIEYRPAYYESYLKEQFGDLYQSPTEAFCSIDETADFPEMSRLLKQLWQYQGDGLPATLYYDAKAAEALSLVFERHRSLNERKTAPVAEADRIILTSLASYIGDHYGDLPVGEVAKAVGYTAAGHFAELFRKAKGTLPLEYRKKMLERTGGN